MHTAPAFGEDDFHASKVHDLPVLITVDDEGKQKPEMGQFANLPRKESNTPIIEDLRLRGLFIR